VNSPLTWTDLDKRAVDTARVLAADAVEKVGNGHPGTAISLAPLAHLLYQKVMNVDPSDENWLGRDRFVLSAGHASLTQYTQLFLAGFGLDRRHRGASHVGFEDAGSPRGPPHQGHRVHDRPAGHGRRQRRRLRDGLAP